MSKLEPARVTREAPCWSTKRQEGITFRLGLSVVHLSALNFQVSSYNTYTSTQVFDK